MVPRSQDLPTGWGGPKFLAAYERNIGRQQEEAVSASVLAQAIVAFMEERSTWSGKASDLKHELDSVAADKLSIDPTNRRTGWPQDAPRLSKEVFRLGETLVAVGIEVSKGWQGKSRAIHIRNLESTVGTVGNVGSGTKSTNSNQPATDGTVGDTDGKTMSSQVQTDSTNSTNSEVASRVRTLI